MDPFSRRQFLVALGAMAVAPHAYPDAAPFRLRYTLSSAMYGEMPLSAILPEVARTGCESIDIWRRVHGNQREQIDTMGLPAFRELLSETGVRVGVSTCYPLGPFGLQHEMEWLGGLGGGVIVTGSRGPNEPEGAEAKAAARAFFESMKPHIEKAEATGVSIAIENHDRQWLYHPDSLRYFAELRPSPHIGIALAFHHLHRWSDAIPGLIRDLGSEALPFIYFQEHSEGIRQKVAKEIEMRQMPGRGELDYRPIVSALRDIEFSGLAEIFMHPTPRGIPILPTVAQISAAINESRAYVSRCLRETHPDA